MTNYEEYANESLKNFNARAESRRNFLVDAVRGRRIERVLDLGCAAGHELLPFLEETDAVCIGVDYGPQLATLTKPIFAGNERVNFVRANGAAMPFADELFDVIICKVALPYMDNRAAIAEIARMLRPGGSLLIKTHSPWFYLWMIKERAKSLNPRQMAYPIICFAAGIWHSITGRQLAGGIWNGKEIFQTREFLIREFARHDVELECDLSDTTRITPSQHFVKKSMLQMLLLGEIVGQALLSI